MLLIRPEQVEAFAQAAAHRFIDLLTVDLSIAFKSRCEELGEGGLREEVQYGLQRAAVYGIVAEREVCKYVFLMFRFGRDFDSDVRHSWAGSILQDTTLNYPSEKIQRLWEAATKEGAQSSGER